jgi:putative nucleotidyltransferase with HDIG domain
MLRFTPGMVLIPLVTGWTAILLLKRNSSPVRLLVATVAGTAMGCVFLVGMDLFSPQNTDLLLHLEGDLVGLAGGTMSCGLVAALVSYPVTALFGFVPRSKLRSLLDLDHPVMKDLAEKAPGTFQHSLSMANLAEKVADEVGADAELVRAGAYYHDIGKMHEPTYFIENQKGENPHDNIEPNASAGKLRGHIHLGTTIAKGANLPERIIDFIVEHHGRSFMEYFIDKAYRQDGKVVDTEVFRYQGRNPTSRETGILMIVDSVEAASRTLSDPSQDDIENLVRRILFGKLLHGYLDDSGLTTRDLKKVGISLVKFLQGQFHVRVEYPWQKKVTGRPPLSMVRDTHAGIPSATAEAPSSPPPPRVAEPVQPDRQSEASSENGLPTEPPEKPGPDKAT